MGLCLDVAGEQTVVEQRARKDFKLLAEHRRSRRNITVGGLRLPSSPPRLTACLRFSLELVPDLQSESGGRVNDFDKWYRILADFDRNYFYCRRAGQPFNPMIF